MQASGRPHTGTAAPERGNEVQQIKESLDIVDLISSYTNLVSAGKRMKGLSPFTNEKTPSFYVDPDEGVYYCFSSQKGGDMFSFVQEVEGVDFKGALAILAELAGVELGTRPQRRTDTSLYDILASAAATYRELLTDDVRSYLDGRGISETSIDVWSIGFAPNEWRTLTGNRTKKEVEQYVKAGLCVRKGDRHFDFFRGRVQFPFHDGTGRIIGFSGRAYSDTNTAKYINSPETMDPPLFNKSTFLYGLHRAKQEIRKQKVAVLTEGPIDAILMHQAGYRMTVATSGTAVTTDHLQQLKRLSGGRLILALDSDDAGKRATLRVIDMAVSIGIDAVDMKVVALPDGQDPADIIASNPTVFHEAFRTARPVASFLTDYIAGQVKNSELSDKVRGTFSLFIPIIAKVQNPMTRDHLEKEAAAFCGVSADSVAEMVSQVRSEDGLNGSSIGRPVPAVTVRQPDRIDALLHTVASSRSFLGDDAASVEEECADQLQAVQELWKLPAISRKEAVLRYEEGMPDMTSQERVALVQNCFRDSVQTLCREARKRQEAQKSRSPVS